jgi:hypothetical protein
MNFDKPPNHESLLSFSLHPLPLTIPPLTIGVFCLDHLTLTVTDTGILALTVSRFPYLFS